MLAKLKKIFYASRDKWEGERFSNEGHGFVV
jgi:hypothetical protein